MDHAEKAKEIIRFINVGMTAEGVDEMFSIGMGRDAFHVMDQLEKMLSKSDFTAFKDAVMARALERSSFRI